jgi:DNA-binding NtrC family response regulator
MSSALEALRFLEQESAILVVTDISMPEMNGLELLERLQLQKDAPPALVVSGEATIDRAVRAVRLGALDFLTKPVEPERFLITVDNALRFSRLTAAHDDLRAQHEGRTQLVGSSEAMTRVRAMIDKVAPSDGRVLILGENGTGKELVAAAVHAGSRRADAPLVTLNCAAVPEALVESELFGHEKGAFTGAANSRRGRFEMADGGTLFLDEVGDMPQPMQAKLLRVLQEGKLERVGGGRSIEVDVRVVAATNQDVAALIRDRRFREDLYYRLNVVTITVPALRDHPEDIPELVRHFLAAKAPREGRRPFEITEAAMDVLSRYPFPGNVRELSNIVERAIILARGDVVDVDDIAMLLPPAPGGSPERSSAPGARYREGVPLKDLMSEAERDILVGAIEAHGGKKSHAALALEVDRSHFYKKCRELGL